MDGGEKAGAKGQRGSDGPATRERPCWPIYTRERPRSALLVRTPHYVEVHARRRRHHLNLVVKNLGTLEMPGK